MSAVSAVCGMTDIAVMLFSLMSWYIIGIEFEVADFKIHVNI